MNILDGKPLRYLIGASSTPNGHDDEITEVPYDAKPAKHGVSIGYCNLFDEENTGKFGPYLHSSDTAAEYHEGQIDPHGPGWNKNLTQQFKRRKKEGFEFIELDNPDAYHIADVLKAIDLAATFGLKVIAKNPGLLGDGAKAYVAHPNVYGIIVERDAGTPHDMDLLRHVAGKPDIPVWFVAFGSGHKWANTTAKAAEHFEGMGVTYSPHGEYGSSVDLLEPVSKQHSFVVEGHFWKIKS